MEVKRPYRAPVIFPFCPVLHKTTAVYISQSFLWDSIIGHLVADAEHP